MTHMFYYSLSLKPQTRAFQRSEFFFWCFGSWYLVAPPPPLAYSYIPIRPERIICVDRICCTVYLRTRLASNLFLLDITPTIILLAERGMESC